MTCEKLTQPAENASLPAEGIIIEQGNQEPQVKPIREQLDAQLEEVMRPRLERLGRYRAVRRRGGLLKRHFTI